MIEELADVAQLRAGYTLQLKLQPTDRLALAERRVRDHRQATARHQLTIKATAQALMGWWDEARLGRVINNLLTNAIKYSPTGGEITVRLSREERDGIPWAMLAVEGHGVGIPATDLPPHFRTLPARVQRA